jgi:signal transduction histidine kinase
MAADAELRNIERLLHDGAQQNLIALAVKLQLARRLGDSDPGALQSLLDEIEEEIHEALEGVRAVADRIYPSVLATRGLAEALRGMAAANDVVMRVEAEELGRYPLELEEAVYFCCRDALEQAATCGARPTLRIWEENGSLCFEVADNAASSNFAGSDLAQIRDRVDTLGGQFAITSGPGAGTRLSAVIPLR